MGGTDDMWKLKRLSSEELSTTWTLGTSRKSYTRNFTDTIFKGNKGMDELINREKVSKLGEKLFNCIASATSLVNTFGTAYLYEDGIARGREGLFLGFKEPVDLIKEITTTLPDQEARNRFASYAVNCFLASLLSWEMRLVKDSRKHIRDGAFSNYYELTNGKEGGSLIKKEALDVLKNSIYRTDQLERGCLCLADYISDYVSDDSTVNLHLHRKQIVVGKGSVRTYIYDGALETMKLAYYKHLAMFFQCEEFCSPVAVTLGCDESVEIITASPLGTKFVGKRPEDLVDAVANGTIKNRLLKGGLVIEIYDRFERFLNSLDLPQPDPHSLRCDTGINKQQKES